MSECRVANWNLRQQRQERVEGEGEGNRSPHVQSDQNLTYVVPMSDYEVMELKWENGEAEALKGNYIDGLETSSSSSKQQQRWSISAGGLKAGGGGGDISSTLESIVEQATNFFPQLLVDNDQEVKYNNNYTIISPIPPTTSEYSGGIKWMDHEMEQNDDDDDDDVVKVKNSISSSSGGKWIELQNNDANTEVKVNVNVNSGGKWREEEKLGVVLKSMGVGGGGASSSGGNKCGDNSSSVLKKRVINRDDDDEEEKEECGLRRRRSRRKGFINELEAGTIISERSRDDHEITTDTTTTIMTWPSFESPPGNTLYHHHSISGSENQQDEERISKEESFRSQSSARTSRAAAVHNQSEWRRRDRINEKMKALQKLVPNASKTDKASMLDEVIEHLKLLQAQIRMMSNARSMMPQMVMPLGMQQQLQMSLLARMGMGMGMGIGMVDINNFARNVPHTLFPLIHGTAPIGGTTPSFLSPPFAMAPMIPPQTSLKTNIDAANSTNTFVPNFTDAYKTLLAQESMNMDFFNKVAALYRQQANQQSNKSDCSMSQPNNGQ